MELITPKDAAAITPRDADGRAHLVGLSGGKDSTALALRLVELHPDRQFTFFCTPTGDELPSMVAHWNALAAKLAPHPFLFIQAKHGEGWRTLDSLIEHFNALPNWRQRWCTRMLKIEPARAYLTRLTVKGPATMYVGLRADEESRTGMYGEGLDVRFPMRDWGWRLAEVRAYLDQHDVEIPQRTDCGRCLYQRLVEWKILSEEHPEVYDDAIRQEDATGHTYRSPGRDTWPSDLRSLREEFKTGRKVRGEEKYRRGGVCRVCTL